MQRSGRFLVCLAILAGLVGFATVPVYSQPFVPPFSQDAVLSYLEQIISLQQDIVSLQADPDSAREAILADTLHQNAAQVSKFGFDFARTQAIVLDSKIEQDDTATAAAPTTQTELDKFAVTVSDHIASLQAQLTAVTKQIARTPARRRGQLLAKKENITGELNLAKAQQDLINNIGQTVKSTSDLETTSGLLKKINNLSRSISTLAPQAADLTAPASGTSDAATITPANLAKQAFAVPDKASEDKPADNRGGLVHLGTDLFAMWKKQAQMRDLKQEITTLRDATKDLRAQLRSTLQNTAKSGNSLAQDTATVKTLTEQKQEFDTLVTNFKQLSASVPALTQASYWLDTTKQTLKDWQVVSDEMLTKTARQFFWHLAILGFAILIPIILSEVARRMTLSYVKDTRRQRQLRLLRRIVFAIIIAIVIALNLASEFGSLATFAGFLTAGIAVALQNILLSLAAHFFFFGRYGVRAGDRVTVGGVTGDVTQVGMVRLYLMEIEGAGDETRPTGRIVAFPNSILFQPTAFFKHMAA